VAKLYLGGITPCPPHPEILKVSLGATKTVPWEHIGQAWRLIDELKNRGVQIVALEQTKKSIPYTKFKSKFPLALIIGNEVSGVSKSLLRRADKVIHIPMYGKKESLNVSVAFGVAGYEIKNY
jgi:tRNA G18 (ribose-2'-O)-methylase SpoU